MESTTQHLLQKFPSSWTRLLRSGSDSPQQVHKASLPGNGGLHPVCELDGIFLGLSRHGRQVPHAADNGPAGHHSQQVRHHPVLAAVPESITELGVVLQDKGTPDSEKSGVPTCVSVNGSSAECSLPCPGQDRY